MCMTDLLFSFFFISLNSAVVHKVLVTPCVCRLGIYSVGPGNKCHSSLYFHCLVFFSNSSCLINFLEVTPTDLLYFTVCFVLLIMSDANWTTGHLFLSWSTGRSQHLRLFIHHIRTGPLHVLKRFSSRTFTPRQPHSVTSG